MCRAVEREKKQLLFATSLAIIAASRKELSSFSLSLSTCTASAENLTLIRNARIPSLTIDHASAFDFHWCRRRWCLANWIYMPRLLDPRQIGCTWFRSTCPGALWYFIRRQPARHPPPLTDLRCGPARPSSFARFYDVKFQRLVANDGSATKNRRVGRDDAISAA